MRIRLAVPDELDDQDRKAALDAALESVTRTVAGMVRAGAAPPAAGHIKSGRVRWQPEPPGDEHFDLPATIIRRGWGDCDDLAPWHAGSLRAGGIDPGARAVVKKSGPKRWHALVRRSDGSIEDPSLHAGMHSVSGMPNNLVGAYAPIQPPMSADGRLCLAICPSRDPRHPNVWFARCDVPDRLEPWDWCSLSAHQDPGKAVLQSIKTVRRVAGDDMDDDDDARLAAVNDLVLGADPDEVADALDEIMGEDFDLDGCMDDAVTGVDFIEEVIGAGVELGSFWDTLKSVAKTAVPIVSKAVQFVPGVGPVASSALDIASQAAQQIPTRRPGARSLADVMRARMAAMHAPTAARAPAISPGRRFRRSAPAAMPGFDLNQIMQMFGGGMPFQISRAGFEPQRVVRPWGPHGPAVMRF